MNDEWHMKVRRALERSWSKKTSIFYNPEIAPLSYGQCAPTAIVVFETFGGEILKTDNAPCLSGRHFYNRIEGERVDFTADQFNVTLAYKDIPSNVADAITETWKDQADQMRVAFARVGPGGSPAALLERKKRHPFDWRSTTWLDAQHR